MSISLILTVNVDDVLVSGQESAKPFEALNPAAHFVTNQVSLASVSGKQVPLQCPENSSNNAYRLPAVEGNDDDLLICGPRLFSVGIVGLVSLIVVNLHKISFAAATENNCTVLDSKTT